MNRVISVFVSSGETSDVMPLLIGKSFREAQLALGQLSVDISIMEDPAAYSDQYAADCVISSFPEAGTTLHSGDKVILRRSLGAKPIPVTVPAFVGLSIDEVRRQLVTLGLTCGTVDPVADALESGTVLWQSVGATDTVEPGTVIDFVVSSGPAEVPEVPVPDASGETGAQTP